MADQSNDDRKVNNLPYPLIRLSLACNARCVFCNFPAENSVFDAKLDDVKKEIKDTFERHNKEKIKISISGGEPTINPDLPEVISYAKKIGIKYVDLQTNAFRFKDIEYAKSIVESGLDSAFVSLHSHIPKKHDILMGVEGAFDSCYQGIINLHSLGVGIAVNTVLNTLNFRDVDGYIKFLHQELPMVEDVSLSVVQPYGRASKNNKLIPRYSQLSPYVRTALKTAQGVNLRVHNPYCGLPICIGGWDEYLDNSVDYCTSKDSSVITDRNKVKGPQCFKCRYNKICSGVWNRYAQLYGYEDLRPL